MRVQLPEVSHSTRIRESPWMLRIASIKEILLDATVQLNGVLLEFAPPQLPNELFAVLVPMMEQPIHWTPSVVILRAEPMEPYANRLTVSTNTPSLIFFPAHAGLEAATQIARPTPTIDARVQFVFM